MTYERSKVAREQESEQAATFYDRVYRAARPELFFKATPSRVVGPGQPIRVRRDTRWCVPEPELALVLSPELEIVGFTIGNDVSARDIEGENPLYLPQAKVYDVLLRLGPGDHAGLGHARPRGDRHPHGNRARLGDRFSRRDQHRQDGPAIRGADRLARPRQPSFPTGVFLLTGTGIVPPDDFSLAAGDIVRITIDGIGTLVNPVIQG